MYQKKFSSFLLLLMLPLMAFAQKHGYDISVDLKGLANQKIYLAMYYGRASTVYKQDSVVLDKKGRGHMQKDTVLDGGLYLLLDTANNYVEFVLNDGDELKVSSANDNKLFNSQITGSTDNDYFREYKSFLRDFEKKNRELSQGYESAKTKADSQIVKEKVDKHFDKLKEYREGVMKKHPESFVSSIFRAIWEPETPQGVFYNEDGSVDSFYQYRFLKNNYWSRFPFEDSRVAFAPIYHNKLKNYFDKLVIPTSDSVAAESLWLLDTTSPSKSMFNYTLWFVNQNIWNSKIMGLNEAIIPIAEKYYGNRENVFWVQEDKDYNKMMEKIALMKPNTIGNVGNNLPLEDRDDKAVMLHDIPADYLVMVFWSPDCGHCRTEVPKIDSFYNAKLKGRKDIQLVGIKTEGDSSVYEKFIQEHDLEKNWMLLDDDKRQSNFRYWYDIETTPVIFILNPKRKIIAKRINFIDIEKIIDYDKNKES